MRVILFVCNWLLRFTVAEDDVAISHVQRLEEPCGRLDELISIDASLIKVVQLFNDG